MEAGPFAGRRLHFVGIGGAGMSGLALVARALGAEVTGSDRVESSYSARLRDAGIVPRAGHDEPPPEGAEIVVSTAIPDDNPELVRARAGGMPILHRGDLLGEVSALKRTIAVGGTHGKTTTASMAALALVEAGRDPAFLIGGELRALCTNAAWGDGEWAVVEADESDRSFLKLSRDVAVVTSVELDHHATYRTLGELRRSFDDFVAPAELAVLGPDVELAVAGRRLSYGIDSGDLRAESVELLPLGSRFVVEGVQIDLAVPGRHNVLNALAAIAACREAGVDPAAAAPGLARFSGAGRRFEDHGRTESGARVFDDYAHHPTEVRATIAAARTQAPRRLVACFQPHLYSRTRLLVAAAAADAAGGRPVWWLPRHEDAERFLGEELREGDVLLTMGAGDVDELARRLAS